VTPHSVYLRTACTLPNRFRIPQDKFDENWLLARNISPATLDSSLRSAGWHFMAIAGDFRKMGFGLTEEAATRRALAFAFTFVCRRYNAAEVESVGVRRILGLKVVTVEIHARHIQQQTVLESIGGKSGQPFATS
jgi:hypothetical protein